MQRAVDENVVMKDCGGCGLLQRPHAVHRGKTRHRCIECRRLAAKQWRQTNWQRRKLRDTWKGMINRCHNPEAMRRWFLATQVPRVSDYADKGIKVCKRWRDPKTGFAAFVKDMGDPPDPKSTLDRLNGKKNYCPSNVRWTDPKTQHENRRTTRWLEAHDPKTGDLLKLPYRGWSRLTGINETTLAKRVKRGVTPDEAVKPIEALRSSSAYLRRRKLEERPMG